MNISKVLIQGLLTHPWAPLALCPLILFGCYAALLPPLIQERTELERQLKRHHSQPQWAQAPAAAELYIFNLFSDVVPWLAERAEQSGVSIAAVSQVAEQESLLLEVLGGFPQLAAFVERVLVGTNLLVRSPLVIEPADSGTAGLRMPLYLQLMPISCTKQCQRSWPEAQNTLPFLDGFAPSHRLEFPIDRHVTRHISVQQLLWVGRLAAFAKTYELVQTDRGDIVLAEPNSRFGIERRTIDGLPGWGAVGQG